MAARNRIWRYQLLFPGSSRPKMPPLPHLVLLWPRQVCPGQAYHTLCELFLLRLNLEVRGERASVLPFLQSGRSGCHLYANILGGKKDSTYGFMSGTNGEPLCSLFKDVKNDNIGASTFSSSWPHVTLPMTVLTYLALFVGFLLSFPSLAWDGLGTWGTAIQSPMSYGLEVKSSLQEEGLRVSRDLFPTYFFQEVL